MKKKIASLLFSVFIVLLTAQGLINVINDEYTPTKKSLDGIKIIDSLSNGNVDTILQSIMKIEEKYKQEQNAQKLREEIEKQKELLQKGEISYRQIFSNVYFAGDSLMNGLEVYGILNPNHLVTKVSASLSHLEENFDLITSMRPPVLILHYGLNMLGTQQAHVDSFIRQYNKDITELKKRLPNTRIIVSLIFPVDTSRATAARFKYIGKYNEGLMKMCKEQNIEYLDSAKIVNAHKDCYSKDGIHMSKQFYTNWLIYIMETKEFV